MCYKQKTVYTYTSNTLPAAIPREPHEL